MNKYDIENYCCEGCLTEEIIATLVDNYDIKHNNYASVSVLCNEELAETLIKIFSVISVDDEQFSFEWIDFDKIDYCAEYGITIVKEDVFLTFSVEKAQCKDGDYKAFESDVVFVSDDCNSKLLLRQIKCDIKTVAFSIGNEE